MLERRYRNQSGQTAHAAHRTEANRNMTTHHLLYAVTTFPALNKITAESTLNKLAIILWNNLLMCVLVLVV